MRSHLTRSLMVLGQVVVLSAAGAAQVATSHSAGCADHPFASIQTSLALAADAALSNTQAEKAANDPSNMTPEAMVDRTFEPNSSRQATTGRFESLRSVIQPILFREGAPESLAAVVLVESAGNPLALSPKGARGLWQLMPGTARRYGLRVDSHLDERVDMYKSTRAASQYLRDLYMQFGSWPLALAAYNTGEQRLQRAIDRAGTNDFNTLSLLRYIPDETRNYVPAVLAEMGRRSPAAEKKTSVAKPATFVYAFSTADNKHNSAF